MILKIKLRQEKFQELSVASRPKRMTIDLANSLRPKKKINRKRLIFVRKRIEIYFFIFLSLVLYILNILFLNFL